MSAKPHGQPGLLAGRYEIGRPLGSGGMATVFAATDTVLGRTVAVKRLRFNYGNALRLSGQPAEAIPVLEARMQIPDQTVTVQGELDAARAEVAG